MKILYLTDQVYLHGGVEKVLSQKANYLADIHDDEVYIVTHNQQNKPPVYKFSDKINWLDLQVNYKIEKSYFSKENLKKIPKHCRNLKRIFAEIKPDIIISASFGPDFYFLPFLSKKIPKIKEYHSSRFFDNLQPADLKAKIFQKLNISIEKKYHAVVVLNKDEKKYYFNKNISVIPNPAEISEYRSDSNSKKILAAGRISPVKNFGDLIEIFSRLSHDFPEWELHFWGEDYVGTQKLLQNKMSDFNLSDKIKFRGVTKDLKKTMENYSIYAMTSATECFPMVLLEALSVGLPVISYDCPTGPKNILTNDEDSFIISYNNLDIFTEKLGFLMQHEDERKTMGAAGIENIQRFSIDIVMGKWINLFKKSL
ncbi:glycosyltransferase family 4 protein [Halpernia frigidisoli]|uniref:Glycosyltransferase involved in cell wall bisynthesis n=1 Tax=Halpernia frigidisoli TaxID=1125876 RepID=A0A1I3FEN3_9FLAO|nr:glycosyltransferase family 4 protein [Halpernia frigidisoli]SFI09552.1 Glycosyltransferase involved in cell wall bisynthesis [Halpernia frigidisoli]